MTLAVMGIAVLTGTNEWMILALYLGSMLGAAFNWLTVSMYRMETLKVDERQVSVDERKVVIFDRMQIVNENEDKDDGVH